MSFKHAREMHSKYISLGITEICVPLSIDASLNTLDVPEEFYPANHEMFLAAQAMEDREAVVSLNEDYEHRLIEATYGYSITDVLKTGTCGFYQMTAEKGNPFQNIPEAEDEREYESPRAADDDLESYIYAANQLDIPNTEVVKSRREDRVRLFFVLSRLVLDRDLIVNFVINSGPTGNHQIGLRRDDENEFSFINSQWQNTEGLLEKDGPLTLREICGIMEQPWSQRPEHWSPISLRAKKLAKVDLFIYHMLDENVDIMVYPPEPKN